MTLRPVRGLVLLAALACGRAAPSPTATTVVDDAGDSVAVHTPAHRVVSLIPATTELLFAIGAGRDVVGRSTWCDYPAEAARVTNLGDGINPNVEAILAARPDLVVLYNSAQNAAVAGPAARARHPDPPDQHRPAGRRRSGRPPARPA